MEMFKYRVKWYDANRAGQWESGDVWEGFDRFTALEKKRECFEIERTIIVLTPGPRGWRSALQEQRDKQEEEARWEVEAEYYDHVCLEHEREEHEKQTTKANTAEVTVHIQKDLASYVVSITFYDENGQMDHGFSSYERPTIREAASNIISRLFGEEKQKAKKSMKELGICWDENDSHEEEYEEYEDFDVPEMYVYPEYYE